MAFNTQRELREALLGVLKEALNEAGEIIKKELHTRVMTDWYMRNDSPPKKNSEDEYYYERTYELINSLTLTTKKDKKNQIVTHVYFDTNKIRPSAQVNNFSGFYAHASFGGIMSYDGTPISHHLISWIEEGNNSPVAPIKGIHMLQLVNDYMESGVIDKIIKSTFKKYGLNIQRV